MKLLLDEMWPGTVAEQLRRAGHDVVAVVERPGLVTFPDAIIFRIAVDEERALVTEDPGFRGIAATWYDRAEDHFGLILTMNRTFPRADPRTAGRLVRALGELLNSGVELRNAEHWLRPPV